MTIYIGVDQSLAATGIAVVRGPTVLHSSCTITAPSVGFKVRKPGKKAPSKAEDDGARVDALTRDFVAAYRIAKERVKAVLYKSEEDIVIAVEAPAGSQSAVSAKCMGLAYGAVRGACYALGHVPLVIPARDAKKALVGSPGASKKAVQARAQLYFGSGWHIDALGKKRNARQREAIADALAIATALMGLHA